MKINQRRSFAFTLVEMIGVLMIIAVFATLLIPVVFRTIEENNKKKPHTLLGTNVSVTELSGRTVDISSQRTFGLEGVGNMTFIRTYADYRDDKEVHDAMMVVNVFERTHPELDVTCRQMVVDSNFRVSFLLNHWSRTTNSPTTRESD